MINILSLFYFLRLVLWLCSILFTDVKAPLFTLIVINLASDDDFLVDIGSYVV